MTLVRCGGHFEGGTVLHWAGGAGGRGVVCAGDILTVTTDRKWLSFMRSYPNFIPLSARDGRAYRQALAPFAFETIYGHYFDRVIAHDAKQVLAKSVARYVAAVNGTRGMDEACRARGKLTFRSPLVGEGAARGGEAERARVRGRTWH